MKTLKTLFLTIVAILLMGSSRQIIKDEIPYSNSKAIAYAKKYAPLKDNQCGKFLYDPDPKKNLSDCAHFIAHCLHAGGITIPNPDNTNKLCPTGLAVRVKDVKAHLDKLSTKYSNVTVIKSYSEIPIIGDYAFLRPEPTGVYRPTHAFMICKAAVTIDEATLYAHTSKRDCEKADLKWYKDWFDSAYRITGM
jgi:hypothetical protein